MLYPIEHPVPRPSKLPDEGPLLETSKILSYFSGRSKPNLLRRFLRSLYLHWQLLFMIKYHVVRCCQVLRSPRTSTTVMPGTFLEVDAPTDWPSDTHLTIEPRPDSASCRPFKSSHAWHQPTILASVGRKIRPVNSYSEPIVIKKIDQICPSTSSPLVHPPLLRSRHHPRNTPITQNNSH